jgi:hypothetical protein
MSNRKLTILAVTAAVMVVLVVLTSHLDNPKPTMSGRNVNLVQGFDTSKIATIILKSKDEETKITQGESGKYVVANKDNYPALINEINGLVAQILDIKTVELITSDAKNHSDLGVAEDNAQYIVKFLDKAGDPIEGFGGIVVSESDPEKQGVYIRLLGKDDVYLVDGSPWPKMGALDYIDKRLTTVDKEKIQNVKVAYADGGYTIKKDDSANVVLENPVPEGKKIKGTEYKNVFNALESLQFTDVMPVSKAGDLDFGITYVCLLEDSTEYTLKIAKKDDKTYVTADADFKGEQSVKVKTDGSESEEELKAKEAKLLAVEATKKFHNAHTGWVYEIASWKAEDLTKKFEDIIEDQEKPKEEAKPAPAAEKADSGKVADPNQVQGG